MKNILKIVSASLILFSSYAYASETLTVTPVKGIPAKSIENTTIENLQYNVHNNSPATAYTISFEDLKQQGITYTTTCGSLSAGGDCKINMTFNVPALPTGKDTAPYIHWFGVLGAPKTAGYILQSTIIKSTASDVEPVFDIKLSKSGVTTPSQTYDVQLATQPSGTTYDYQSLELGKTTAFQPMPVGNYLVDIFPTTVTGSDSDTYKIDKSSEDQKVHVTKDGQIISFTYDHNSTDVSVSTDLTMPNAGAATSSIECKGDGQDYGPTDQASGTNSFATMIPGDYTCTASNYTGTDTETYVPTLTNPYTINQSSSTIDVTFTAKAPTEQHVKTNITAPNLPAGKTVAIGADDGAGHTYNHNQAAGDTTFDTMEDGSYTVTAADYSVGPDDYVPTLSNPYTVGPGNTEIAITYAKQPPAGHQYDWSASHLTDIKNANIFAIYWGGGSTTAPVHISSNPPVNPWLNSKISAYEDGTPTPVGANAVVQEFPAYIAMGTVTETDAGGLATDQLKNQKLDASFHYEGNGAGDRGCFWDGAVSATCTSGPYTPEVTKMADQAVAVKAVNSHTLIPSEVFYTIDMSDGTTAIDADTQDDNNVIPHLYNLMYEAQIMEAKQQAGTPMALFLNPDSTFPFQECGQYYCPVAWKPGISQDPKEGVIKIPNLKADTDAALDRMQAKGYLTSGEVTTLKASLVSSGILTPPPASKRTVPGLPELVLVNNWIIKSLAPHVPFGWGVNAYDNNNPQLTPGGKAEPWETGSITWLHKINHLGLSAGDITAGIDVEGTKLANYLKDMNMVGNATGDYKPDFIYFDKYERDPIPGYVSTGFAFNGVDWDTYLEYIKATDSHIDNLPVAIWQMPGASLQVQGATFTGDLAATVPNWVFGDPVLKNDFSNVAAALNLSTQLFTQDMNTSVYFTKNSKVANLQDYLELGAGSP